MSLFSFTKKRNGQVCRVGTRFKEKTRRKRNIFSRWIVRNNQITYYQWSKS